MAVRTNAYSGLPMGCSHVCLVPVLATSMVKALNFEITPDLQPRRGDRL